MAKSTATKKPAPKPSTKASVSTSIKKADMPSPAKDNPSKFQPGESTVQEKPTLTSEDGLMKLFVDSVMDLYWAENHLVNALPKMARSTVSKSLKDAITEHLAQTETHVERLKQVFDELGRPARAKKCDAMEGLIKEGEGVIESTDSGTPARDLGIIMASQKVEHYEIAAYTGLIKLADKLALPAVSELLSQTLDEEELADQILGDIADHAIAVDTLEDA